MTPTEQDEELREQIHKLFGDHQADDGGYQSCYDGKWIDMTNEVCAVADFIAADRKRVALEARIDELKNIPVDVHQKHASHTNFCMRIGYRNARIREIQQQLKAQQEEV